MSAVVYRATVPSSRLSVYAGIPSEGPRESLDMPGVWFGPAPVYSREGLRAKYGDLAIPKPRPFFAPVAQLVERLLRKQ